MFKITKGTSKTLTELVNMLGKYLNPKSGKDFTPSSLIGRVDKIIAAPATNVTHLPFYNFLADQDHKILKAMLIAEPVELTTWIDKVDKMVTKGQIPKFYTVGETGKASTDFGKEVLKLFGYANYRKTQVFFQINKELHKKFCNYCNLDTTLSISGGKSLFDCDHYFSKVEYPYLSVSFYNLISSCTICNTRLKTAKPLNLKSYPHPYLDEVNDYIRFTTDKPLAVGKNIDDFTIIAKKKKVSVQKAIKGVNLVNFFALDLRYTALPATAIYLFKMSNKYPATAKKDLYDEFLKLGRTVTKEEIIIEICETLQIPLTRDEAANTQMGKLRLDLAEEFKITQLF